MRNDNKSKGFTLIELLIVIAIIGILAAVLIPNLLGARQQAQIRAAQAHNSNVVTAATAYMAENVDSTPATVVTADANCADGVAYDSYTVSAAPSNVSTCTVADNGNGGVSVVSTLADGSTITNGGAPVAATTQ